MTKYYHDQQQFLVSVDCIILGFKENNLHVLAFRRKFDPLKGERSLMGGFVQPNEGINDTAARVLLEYTGINDVFMEQVGTYGQVGRDIGERVISIAYYALVNMEQYDEKLKQEHNSEWLKIDVVGDMIFDHNLMLNDAIKLLQQRAASKPIGFNLLSENFTIPQLQSLYEAIYQRPLDKRNFRKKLFEMDVLEKLDEKDKSTSKKGAYFYRFNKEKYDKLLLDGYYFSL